MAPDQIGESMTEGEIQSLLRAEGHGVLGLAAGNRGYGIPVSFAYDESKSRFILEFVNLGDTKKEAFIEASEEVTLTVHNFEDSETWESVIVTGTLEPLDADEVSERSAAQFFAKADDAATELRWVDDPDIDRQWYALRPTDMSGRHGGSLPHQLSRGLVRFSGYDRTY